MTESNQLVVVANISFVIVYLHRYVEFFKRVVTFVIFENIFRTCTGYIIIVGDTLLSWFKNKSRVIENENVS